MKSPRAKRPLSNTLYLAIFATFAISPALAAEIGWYGGASVGQSRAELDEISTFNSLLGSGFSAVSINHDRRDRGYKLFGGYQFNRNFALEGGYFDLGRFGYTVTTLPAGTLSSNIKFRGVNLDVVGILPVTARLSALARVGVNYTEAKDAFSGTGAVVGIDPSATKRDSNYKYGLGLKYEFTPRLALLLEAERYRVSQAISGKSDIDLYSLGLVYRFGGKAASPSKVAWQPAVAAPQPVTTASPTRSAPVPAVATPRLVIVKVPTERYCSTLDIQFEIDRDDIQRKEQVKLAVLATFMTMYPETTAIIEGHTDNVGSQEHNQQLSRQRADKVVSYLVESLRIAPSRLSAVGYGGTRPIADNQSEIGKRMNRRIDAIVTCVTDIEGLTVASARLTMALLIESNQSQADVRPEYRNDLHKVANFLKANPPVTATVAGHTGNLQGNPEQALVIAQQHAQNVVNVLW